MAIAAIAVFAITYIALLCEKVDKTVAALSGGCIMILLRVVNEQQAFAAIDLSVIFLLLGMMIIVHFLGESGFFGYVAIRLAQVAKGRPIPLIVLLCLVTGVLSALVDNVTTVLLIAPVTFLITAQLEVSPVPYLVMEALASNIGGTATLVGDPPNILIGSAAGLSFSQFLLNLGPITLLCLLALVVVAVLLLRKQGRVSRDIRARVMDMNASRAIRDRALLVKTGAVLGAVFLAFLVHDKLHLLPATVALSGAALLLLLTQSKPAEAFRAVEWPTLFFFIGLFMLVEGLRVQGVLDYLAHGILTLTQGNFALTSLALLWFAAFASAFLGAVPIVTTMVPVVETLIPQLSEHVQADPGVVHRALWWSLALGSCLGGNGTMLGTAANVVVVDIAKSNRQEISFLRFMAYGMPVMLMTLVLATVYVLARYVF